MDEVTLRQPSTIVDAPAALSWAAITAGAVAAAALSLLLIAFGSGLGLSAVSPWSDTGVSSSTFQTATGIYVVIVAVMSSAVGGYLAGRLQTKWAGLHAHEAFFRDTAHGFLAWALATLISATALSSATAYLANGAAAGLATAGSQAGRSINPADLYVDELFRPVAAAQPAPTASSTSSSSPPASDTGKEPNPNSSTPPNTSTAPNTENSNQARAEILRLWTSHFQNNQDPSGTDKAYVAQVVAARTGMSQADAEKRVNDVIAEAKTNADSARNGAAKLSFWLTAAMLFGAFAASLAAAEGGSLRDGTWNGRVLTPRPL
jgi:hypothetical protein